jgi:broad specificity phosphatase PhoE
MVGLRLVFPVFPALLLLEFGPMLRLIFVRHGRTPWNAQGRVQGGGGLDEVGRAQAAALGNRLRDEPFDAIYASPTLRARQTARAVARTHDMKIRQRYLLHDLSYGKYGGALLADVQREEPELVALWKTEPHKVRFEGGESLGELRARIVRFVGDVGAAHARGTVLIATHDSPVRVALSLALGIEDAEHNREDLVTQLASINEFELEDEVLTLRRHNDIDHLRGLDA